MATVKVQSKDYGTTHDLALHSNVYAALAPGDTIEISLFSVDQAMEVFKALTPAQRAKTLFRWAGMAPGLSNFLPLIFPH